MEEFQCPAFYWQMSNQDQCNCPCHQNTNSVDINSFGGGINNSFSSNGIIKSEYDKRNYAAITLANKLKVLLISDPGADKAAGALCVLAGTKKVLV